MIIEKTNHDVWEEIDFRSLRSCILVVLPYLKHKPFKAQKTSPHPIMRERRRGAALMRYCAVVASVQITLPVDREKPPSRGTHRQAAQTSLGGTVRPAGATRRSLSP